MVITEAEAPSQSQGRLRPMDPTRDLGAIADLIAEAFAGDIDERGRAALREMRWMAHLRPLVWWWSQADPTFRDSFNGFVWEEPSPEGDGWQVVGNVSLTRAQGSRSRWIICNVVVQSEYRGRGLGQQLTQAAIAEAQALGAIGTVLQVYKDNRTALRLYTDLGFQEAAGETDLRLETVQSVAFLEAPGYHLRAWQPADGRDAYELARLVTPQAQQWLRPLRVDDYRTTWWSRLSERISDLVTGRRVYRLTIRQDDQLAAMLTVAAAFRQGQHHLSLLVHPEHTGRVEAILISRALHMLAAIPPRPVKITLDHQHTSALNVLRDYGFEKGRTLLTLKKDF